MTRPMVKGPPFLASGRWFGVDALGFVINYFTRLSAGQSISSQGRSSNQISVLRW